MLKFQTRSGGTADIKIESAVIHTAGENAEEFDVTTLASTYVTISGEDTVGDTPPEESQETETGEENPVSDIPTVMEVPVEEQTYYLVDLSSTRRRTSISSMIPEPSPIREQKWLHICQQMEISVLCIWRTVKKTLPVRLQQ
ncbi:MAG: hypothetical protein ACLUPF_05610 [Dorea sp.]